LAAQLGFVHGHYYPFWPPGRPIAASVARYVRRFVIALWAVFDR
jgi:hypothetical protein